MGTVYCSGMKQHIFDLDGTVICSKHRQRLKPCGDLDLDHWLAHRAERSAVMGDTLLPFSAFWKTLQRQGFIPSICTSRVVTDLEYEFLRTHGLFYDHFIHRTLGDMRGDADYKVARIRAHLDATGWDASSTTLYDDHAGVRAAVKSQLGLRVFNPVPFNMNSLVKVTQRKAAN